MLEKIEKIFPEVIPALRRQTVAVRVVVVVFLLIAPFMAVRFGGPVAAAVRNGQTVEVPVAAMALGITIVVMVTTLGAFLWSWLRRRARLKRFLAEWLAFRQEFFLLHTRVGTWLLKNRSGFNDPDWPQIESGLSQYWARGERLRRLVYQIGEPQLVGADNQYWLQLKREQKIFDERDYLSPFSFLLDLRAPIAQINHHGEAIWRALQISDDYVEYLRFKWPFLERVKSSAEAEANAA